MKNILKEANATIVCGLICAALLGIGIDTKLYGIRVTGFIGTCAFGLKFLKETFG